MSNDIISVDSYDFDTRIEFGITMVYFYSEWCAQSRALRPIMEEIADEYYDNVRVLALDVEQSPDIASIFAVENTPAVIIFRNGKIVNKLTGTNPPSVYADALDEIIK